MPIPLDFAHIRYLAIDLDGTLLRTDKSISPRARNAIQQAEARGLQPIIATARPPRTAESFLKDFLTDAPRIYYSGARIHVNGNLIRNRTIPIQTALSIIETFEDATPDARISLEIDDRLYANYRHHLANPEDVLDLRRILDREPINIMLNMTTPDLPKGILDLLPNDVRCVVSDAGTLAQIMNTDVSKSAAVERIVAERGGAMSQVLAFGDDTNDIDLIKNAGIGVALSNAVDLVKDVADHITVSNDEDGVAVVIETLLETGLPLSRTCLSPAPP